MITYANVWEFVVVNMWYGFNLYLVLHYSYSWIGYAKWWADRYLGG